MNINDIYCNRALDSMNFTVLERSVENAQAWKIDRLVQSPGFCACHMAGDNKPNYIDEVDSSRGTLSHTGPYNSDNICRGDKCVQIRNPLTRKLYPSCL